MKLSVVIPVFNEAATVEELLNRVFNVELPGVTKEIIIVESNSTDGSRRIVERVVATPSANLVGSVQLILQEKGRGKGNAVREGLERATGDIILIQDADLEYDINDYPALIKPIVDKKTSFVLGSRHLSASGWQIRRFQKESIRTHLFNLGGVFFHGIFNILYGLKLTDPTTMFKVFERKCISGLDFTSDRFDFDFELVGKLIRAGYTPIEVPVSYFSRSFKDGKKIRVFRDPITWIIAIFKFRFTRLHKKESTVISRVTL